jgi:hypothetical protein
VKRSAPTRRAGVQVRGEDDAANPSTPDHDTPDGADRAARWPAAGDTGRTSRADAAKFPMTRRTSRDPGTLDVSPLIRTIQYLDEVLKRGVVIGVYEDSKEVSDEDIHKALTAVRCAIGAVRTDMEMTLRSVARATGQHEAPGALQ